MNKEVKGLNNLKPTVGLEVHVQLATKSGMFCGCPAFSFKKKPNTQTCPVCLGLPGALPVPNKKAIDWTIKIALSLGGRISSFSKFDRKHYFYPDLPKGYQISQYDNPISKGGALETTSGLVKIRRIHIEEDTGKLSHKLLNGKKVTLIDFNRSGVPLVEIVTEPDINSGEQAKEYAQELQKVVRYLKVSDCDMEKGSMRLEANVSWGLSLGYKVEVKNLNSFRFVQRAIDYELSRQWKILEKGNIPQQETRGWDEENGITFLLRSKEKEADYRYFPEPDIPPMHFSNEFINTLKRQLPEFPQAKKERLIKEYKITKDYAKIATESIELSTFYEKLMLAAKENNLEPQKVLGLAINNKIKNITQIIKIAFRKEQTGIKGRDELLPLVREAISQLPQAVSSYREGKVNAAEAIVGAVMRLSHGRANPIMAKKLIEELIQKK